MRPNIINTQFTLSIAITEEMTAILDNQQIHPVYSTFWLVYHAELASRKAIEPFLNLKIKQLELEYLFSIYLWLLLEKQ